MGWSAALGLAGSAFSAISASNTASAQMAMQQRELDQQRDLQEQQLALAMNAERRQSEENAYRRQIEQMNRLIQQQERGYQLDQVEQQRAQLLEERRADIERQIQEDREAARQREFQLSQLLQNQDLAAEEREFAEQQLAEAQAIAAGERDEDKRRYLEERAMAEANRDFVIGEYEAARQQAASERQRDLDIQNMIMAQAQGLQDSLQGTAAQLGYVPEIPVLSEADIASEINRRTQQYQSDVDRAADRVASVNEADLIRSGLDESTPGTARRGEVAARLSQEYQNARQRAYDDALNYITGRQGAMSTNVANILDRRQAMLGETADISGAQLNTLQNLRNAQSATGVYEMAAAVPDGIYQRGLVSANDYRAPVNVDTSIYDGTRVSSGLAGYINPGSAATTAGLRVRSAAAEPISQTLQNPSTYYGNAQRIGNNILSQVSRDAATAYDRAAGASAGFGSAFRDLVADNSDQIDDFMSGIFSNSGGNSGNYVTYDKSMFGL